jgi:asparagine synthetase B (glutamine-hydrolysing)
MATAQITSIAPDNYIDFSKEPIQKLDSKVVFSGLGADEIFGGYARYKTAFIRGGSKEME